MLDHGQPIKAWAEAQSALTADDRAAILALVGVRTVGDLQSVLEELPKALAAKVKKVLAE